MYLEIEYSNSWETLFICFVLLYPNIDVSCIMQYICPVDVLVFIFDLWSSCSRFLLPDYYNPIIYCRSSFLSTIIGNSRCNCFIYGSTFACCNFTNSYVQYYIFFCGGSVFLLLLLHTSYNPTLTES